MMEGRARRGPPLLRYGTMAMRVRQIEIDVQPDAEGVLRRVKEISASGIDHLPGVDSVVVRGDLASWNAVLAGRHALLPDDVVTATAPPPGVAEGSLGMVVATVDGPAVDLGDGRTVPLGVGAFSGALAVRYASLGLSRRLRVAVCVADRGTGPAHLWAAARAARDLVVVGTEDAVRRMAGASAVVDRAALAELSRRLPTDPGWLWRVTLAGRQVGWFHRADA